MSQELAQIKVNFYHQGQVMPLAHVGRYAVRLADGEQFDTEDDKGYEALLKDVEANDPRLPPLENTCGQLTRDPDLPFVEILANFACLERFEPLGETAYVATDYKGGLEAELGGVNLDDLLEGQMLSIAEDAQAVYREEVAQQTESYKHTYVHIKYRAEPINSVDFVGVFGYSGYEDDYSHEWESEIEYLGRLKFSQFEIVKRKEGDDEIDAEDQARGEILHAEHGL